MNPLLMGLMSGGASLLGSVFSSSTSAQNTQAQIAAQEQMQNQTEDFNASQAQISRDYNTQMSNTAFQRSSADMKAAGLNPMIMANGGGPASVPSSPTASVGTPTVPLSQNKGAMAGLGEAANQAISGAVTAKTMDKLTDEIANLQASRGLITAETELAGQKTKTEQQETVRRGDEASLAGLSIPAARFSALQSEDLLSLPSWARSLAVQGGFLGGKASDVISPITNSANTLRRFLPTTSERSRENSGGGSFDEFYRSRVGG